MNVAQLWNSDAAKGPSQSTAIAQFPHAASEGELQSLVLPSPPKTAGEGFASYNFDPAELTPWKVSESVAPFLAESLQARWRLYRTQLRRCKREFSEESVHE